MGRWSDFDQAAGYGAPFLSGQEKAAMAEEGTPFRITEAFTEDKRSIVAAGRSIDTPARWVVRIAFEESGDVSLLALGRDQRRDVAFSAVAAALSNGESSIGPVVLRKTTTKAGRPYYFLADAPTDEEGEAWLEAQAETAGDDDLPF